MNPTSPLKHLRFISPWVLQNLIWIPTRLIFLLLGHLRIRGGDNLRKVPHNVIFACNHSGEVDAIVLPASLPFFSRFSPMFYTSREQAFYTRAGWRQHFYGGVFFKLWGSYPVKTGLHDYAKSVETLEGIVRQGGSLCIFPEGRATRDGNIQPAKGGVAYLSWATGQPVVPVRIGGTFRMSLADFVLGRSHLSVSFGEPMYMTSASKATPTVDEFKAFATQVMDRVREMASATAGVPAPVPIRVPKVA